MSETNVKLEIILLEMLQEKGLITDTEFANCMKRLTSKG